MHRLRAQAQHETREDVGPLAPPLGACYPTRRVELAPMGVSPMARSEQLRERHARTRTLLAAEVKRGGCGVAGCEDAGCPYAYGECHCGCGEQATIARESARSKQWIRGEPKRYRSGHQGNNRGPSLVAREGGARLREARLACELTMNALAKASGSSSAAISQLEGIEGFRVSRAKAETIARALHRPLVDLFEPPPTPKPAERRRTRPALPAQERHSGARRRRAAEQAEQRRARGLLNRKETARRLGVDEAEVTAYVQRELLIPAERVGGEVRFRQDDVVRFEREWARALDGRRRWWLDPKERVAYMRRNGQLARLAARRGLTEDEAAVLVAERVKRRLATLNRRRQGRTRGAGPPAYHHEWAARFATLMQEHVELYESYHVDGDPPPTNWEVAQLVAAQDHADHPERWSYSPEEHPREAARRVWRGVKPLQNAVPEILAA